MYAYLACLAVAFVLVFATPVEAQIKKRESVSAELTRKAMTASETGSDVGNRWVRDAAGQWGLHRHR